MSLDLFMLLLGYLLGSLCPSYWIPRLVQKIDIRERGSGVAGGHNVMVEVGRGWGALATALDFLKGGLAAWLGLRYGSADWMGALAGVAAILGHNYPFYLRFRAGKGLSPALGALLVLMPLEAFLGMLVLGLFFLLITHSISSAAIAGFGSMSLLAAWRDQPAWLTLAPLAFLSLIALGTLPEGVRMWRAAPDKGDLLWNHFIRDVDGGFLKKVSRRGP